MGVLRSETMSPGVLVMPSQKAASFLSVIGQKTQMQFQDMKAGNVSAPRPWKRYVQRIEEMERILRYVDTEVKKYGFAYFKNEVDGFLDAGSSLYKLDDVEKVLKYTYSQFVTFKSNDAALLAEKNAAIEEKWVVQTSVSTFGSANNVGVTGLAESLLGADSNGAGAKGLSNDTSMVFSNIAGVIADEEQQRFARFLFRMSRGNTFTSFVKIDEPVIDPKSGKEMSKSVFVVFFQDIKGGAGQESLLRQRIVKACQQFGVNQYEWPFSGDDARRRLTELGKQVLEKTAAQEAYSQFIVSESARLLSQTRTGNSLIEDYKLFCTKEKSNYAILNQCEGDSTLRINVWYPTADEEEIRGILVKESSVVDGAAYLINDKTRSTKGAPTYFRTNEFLTPFQDVVNTYGVPRYKEASPVPFTAVTFPFIFGIMYGDVGHGSIVLLFALWLCCNAESLKKSQPDLVAARYMLVLMGMFATYAGFLYNDFFSLGMNLFGSRFATDASESDAIQEYYPLYDVKNTGGKGPYPFGIDPAWAGAQNELLFLNSLKMKMAVCFGVAQMTMGLVLKWSNALYERSLTDLLCECIPCMIFMCCFFGYMDYMILYKWTTPLDTPPSLINSLIAMAMGQVDNAPLWDGAVALEGQLMKYTMISVPWLLFPKIIVLYIKEKAKSNNHDLDKEAIQEEHGHSFAEEAIEQVIFTIEFVLGTVSHTASYLRMWALSLAHQQLSLVFFQKTLVGALTGGNPISIYLGFAAWLMVTFAVLLCMDTLECFLHTLRLHWVEFQSKFFRADGYLFAPYSHKKLLSAAPE